MVSRFKSISGLALSAALAAVAGAPLTAADGHISDLRLVIGVTPDIEPDGGNDLDGGVRVGVQYMRNFMDTELTDVGGWIWGAELSHTLSDDEGVEIQTIAITALAGYAYQLKDLDNLHFEGTPFLGFGISNVDAGDVDDDDTYIEYGLRGAGFWTFDSQWQLGLDLRLLASNTSIDGNDLDQGGLMASVVGGYRF